jgi:hypothetical protein
MWYSDLEEFLRQERIGNPVLVFCQYSIAGGEVKE